MLANANQQLFRGAGVAMQYIPCLASKSEEVNMSSTEEWRFPKPFVHVWSGHNRLHEFALFSDVTFST